MHSDQSTYRQLYDAILAYEGDALFDDVLAPWLPRNDDERRWLARLGGRRGAVPTMAIDERWRLYALSRVVDLLQLSSAPRADDAAWTVAPVSRDDFGRFMDALGMERINRPAFHPFLHEVVTVDQLPDECAAPAVVDEYWPGYLLGPLLISRAGCRVEAGRRHLVKEIAEQSTLYWAHARNNRPAADLSRGWGNNSQWRTNFRRDYVIGGVLHYNVDARVHPLEMDEDLDAAERLELLRNRCFVTCAKPSDDRWPYDLSHVEQI